MQKWLTITILLLTYISAMASGNVPGKSYDFSVRDGQKVVRSITPGDGISETLLNQRRPIRNPNILARVIWVDRNSEFAIAENVTTTPDGSSIFAGWWLNNQRFANYASAGLELPVWKYYQTSPWQMPVSASNTNFAGTGSGLPIYIWDKDSPLFTSQINVDPGYNGGGVSFSGDGNLLAAVTAIGQTDAVLTVYSLTAHDTVFTTHFEPIQGLYGVDVSLDGTVVVVSCYGQLYVYEIPSGNFRGALYNYSQGTAKISGDGSLITTGTYTGVVYLYEWDGSQYSSTWIRSTGHDWVTAVDISDDGSTVACGTMDFNGGQIAGGKFMEWDSSGQVLIDYGEYGDMVASVALSGTGEYAIAGSWGQYGATYGDVVTCFYRGIDIPMFQLLDDIDEPGSVFGVAISDSGHYAAAGGKAVHAREFGNGGMLYSIKLRDPLTNDVAVASIDDPGEFAIPGDPVTPTATFINVGSAIADFVANCSITNLENNQVIYTSSFNITNLSSFSTSQVFFSPDFVMPSDGRFRMQFDAAMASDEDTTNNHLALVLRSWHDLRGVAVSSPFNNVTVNWSFIPIATFKNMGSYTETADINLSIFDSTNTEVFTAVTTIYDLAPYATEEVQFDGWTPSIDGYYRAAFTAQVPGDLFPDDNIIEKSFSVVNEMIYDDGIADAAFWVDAYPSSANRKFAQRFDPNILPPSRITNIRFFQPNITYSGSFDYMAVAGEVDGFPDTSQYAIMLENPILPGPNSWASFDFDFQVGDNGPLWVILHWADTPDGGPYIGADNTGVIDLQSYWYSDNTGLWNLWRYNDWMIRMTLLQGTGVQSDIFSGLPDKITLSQNFPNPFNPSTTIEFALPDAGNIKLDIFNYMGQKVRSLVRSYLDAGFHSAIWDGRTDGGQDASSGVYYYRLTAGDYRISKKMMMVK